MPNHKFDRWQLKTIENALKTRRVIILAGARQTGKTTLVRYLASLKNSTIYRNLDEITLLEEALSDPHGFVTHNDELMVIDDIQRAPRLLQAIKQEVDLNPSPGRFLLTGSADIQSLANVSGSLAGRVRKIRLRTLSQGELLSQKPDFIQQAFTESFEKSQPLDKADYLSLAVRGGYPEVVNLERKERRRWHQDYLETLIECDLKDIANIRRKDSMYKLIEVLAAWSSKFMDISAIGSSLALARPTVVSYINALESLFLIERIRPWCKTDYARVNKFDKLFMVDTGLMTAILNWNVDKICLDGDKNGKLLETFVFNQLSALLDTQADDFVLYHYRDREKREIDFIIENENDELLAIEVKAGTAIKHDDFKHLIWFKKTLSNNNKFIGIILYTGKHIMSFGEHLWAIPMSALWV
jgi:uncharacterized protein